MANVQEKDDTMIILLSVKSKESLQMDFYKDVMVLKVRGTITCP